eukprot:6268229-Amphidinium_carterae.1
MDSTESTGLRARVHVDVIGLHAVQNTAKGNAMHGRMLVKIPKLIAWQLAAMAQQTKVDCGGLSRIRQAVLRRVGLNQPTHVLRLLVQHATLTQAKPFPASESPV